jgi:hypothetical protein
VVFTDVALGSSISARLDQASINIPNYADYRVTIEGLPEGYALKAMKYGPMDILGGRLSVRSNGIGATGPGGASFAPQPQVISIVIDGAGASKQSSGVRVSGSIRGNPQRVIYLSGAPGTIFTDGSFEFRNVSPGRHTIATLNNPPSLAALAAVVIVGSKDLNDVTVESVSALPLNPRILSAPGPAGARPPGPVPLASLRGRILDAETGSPVTAGTVFVVGDTWAGCPIGPDGSFQFPRLLPGNYELEVQGQGYPTFRRAIVIDEQDLEVELRAG